jgi:hypothetical protein
VVAGRPPFLLAEGEGLKPPLLLLAAIVLQAELDLNDPDEAVRLDAQSFFRGELFSAICDYAGHSPRAVRSRIYRRHFVNRASAQQEEAAQC